MKVGWARFCARRFGAFGGHKSVPTLRPADAPDLEQATLNTEAHRCGAMRSLPPVQGASFR